MKSLITLLGAKLLIITIIHAQISETFNDGNLSSNVTWEGDTSEFTVNKNNQLQLNNPGFAGISSLSTLSECINDAIWNIFVKLQFNPSSSNYCNVYLTSNNSNLESDVDGYFVKIGGVNDEISLYRQDAMKQTKIIDGKDDLLDVDSVFVYVKVTRDVYGNWELYSDLSLTGNYELEGAAFDNNYYTSEYFGIVCAYTSTRSNKFFFDDVIIKGDPFNDSIVPKKIPIITEFGQVLINELMIDPEPSVQLPEYEYIELFNNSDNTIELSGWFFTFNNKFYTLPQFKLKTEEYIIIIPDKAQKEFSDIQIIPLQNFPSLTNLENLIQLFDKDSDLIHFVNYNESWHDNILKKEGGWSLEMIDVNNPCGKKENWSSSISKSGGTPGYKNLVSIENKDLDSPYLDRIGVADRNAILLFLNESLNPGKNINISSISVSDEIGTPIILELNPPDYSVIKLSFQTAFQTNKQYRLSIHSNLEDCAGNISEDIQDIIFALPDTPAFNDIVINELLFNPIGNGEDFIEFYNNSSKVFDLNKLIIATKEIVTGEINNFCKVSEISRLFFPYEYFAITTSFENIHTSYYCPNPKSIIEIKQLPNFPNDEGIVVIFDIYQKVIDEFEYNENMHFELLPNTEGVSLERVKPEQATNDKNNWHSAAETVGYATPGYQNSQYRNKEVIKKSFKLVNKVFSPDNDGFEDLIEIDYQLDEPGSIATIIIYNSKGRIIRTIADHVLLETFGSFYWDGSNDFGQLAQIGVYIIYIQTYDLKGNVKKYKKTCVLAKKL